MVSKFENSSKSIVHVNLRIQRNPQYSVFRSIPFLRLGNEDVEYFFINVSFNIYNDPAPLESLSNFILCLIIAVIILVLFCLDLFLCRSVITIHYYYYLAFSFFFVKILFHNMFTNFYSLVQLFFLYFRLFT